MPDPPAAAAQDETGARLRRRIERLGPYPSLALMVVPLALVEPLKVVAVFIAGEGHWLTGSVALVVAYALSVLVVERLFRIVKPKLLTLPWFARLWVSFDGVTRRAWRRLVSRFRR